MKRFLFFGLVSILLVTTLGGCGSSTIYDAWQVDKENHWKLSDDGNKVNNSAHTLEGDTCTVCGAKIAVSDGSMELTRFNEQEDPVQQQIYDTDGSKLLDKTYEYEYNEDNTKAVVKEYEDGMLTVETTYQESAIEGETVEATQKYYNEDNSKSFIEFNEYGDITKESHYGPMGELVYEASYEFVYDGADQKTYHKYHEDGKMTEECEYKYDKLNTYTYEWKKTTYNQDGTKTVTEYNEDRTIHKQDTYDAAGNKVEDKAE